MSTLFDDDFDTLEIDSPDQNHLRKYREKTKILKEFEWSWKIERPSKTVLSTIWIFEELINQLVPNYG